LIYIKPKQQTFHEFYRVLKPGGWISLFEPINRFGYPAPEGYFAGYDLRPVLDLVNKVHTIYEAIQPPDDPMLDFDERDLIAFADQAGFSEIHLELHADIQPIPGTMPWDTFWKYSPNPKVPAIGEAIQQALTPKEVERFVGVLRSLVETNQNRSWMAAAYLWARK
jgi:ubiquinone/menaquinone biosynthesis C-methylase UbiE